MSPARRPSIIYFYCFTRDAVVISLADPMDGGFRGSHACPLKPPRWIWLKEKTIIAINKMITEKQGEEAVSEIEQWANRITRSTDAKVQASVYYDADSNTYILRLAKGSRVLLFRLSEAQVQTREREEECEKILRRKIRDLSS